MSYLNLINIIDNNEVRVIIMTSIQDLWCNNKLILNSEYKQNCI